MAQSSRLMELGSRRGPANASCQNPSYKYYDHHGRGVTGLSGVPSTGNIHLTLPPDSLRLSSLNVGTKPVPNLNLPKRPKPYS